ncbi:WIF1_4 [Blepharisma stoltei]|uniref:EGF-like domain-containing protein n=1 Tax=Blepharisma stoltei TaxID=1481888 RepID=A0AAU9IZK7_9CILI|nr:unnamed protein product [Blepharisma stoltei]
MLIWLLLSFIPLSFQFECGVGPDWKPDIKQYPHQGRRLETGLDRGTTFEPIRIHFDYSNLTLTSTELDTLRDEIIPSIQHWFQTVLKVNPLLGSLQVPQEDCNEIPIPESHKTEGIANTDFAVYLSNINETESSIIAYAGPCLQDSGGRYNVLAGSFTINTAIFNTLPKHQAIAVAIHELTHALVFSPDLYTKFVKADGSHYEENELYQEVFYENRGKSAILITLPTVAEKAKEIYGCSSIPGLELEDYGSGSAGAHWEMKIVAEDYMVSVLPDFPAYSNLTLALFQDSGWYKVDFSYAQSIIIGNNEGCERFEDKCIANGKAQPGFCTESKEMCDYTRTNIGICGIYNYSSELPTQYQYFDDPYKAGMPYPDGCPIIISDVKNCRDPDASADSSFGEIVGEQSRCFEASLVLDTLNKESEIWPTCYKVVSCEEDKVVVGVGDQTVDCPFSGGDVTVPGYDGVLTCPDSSICKGIVPCINSCYGQGKCPKGTCICDPGFGGKDCSIICGSTCKSCDDKSSCASCYSTATLADGICSCPDGSTWDDIQKVCMPGSITGCPKECNGCADDLNCAACYDSMTLNDKNLCECPSGKAFSTDSNSCKTIEGCPDSCNGCDTPQTCLSCYDTATLQNGECFCPEGHYFISDTNVCQAYLTEGCSAGCEYCKSSSECVRCSDENAVLYNGECKCKIGYFPDEALGSAQCNKCNDGCYSCESLTTCKYCDDVLGVIQDDGTCICKDGYWNDSDNTTLSCYECRTGCKICDGYFECNECMDSMMTLNDGVCECPNGMFINDTDSTNIKCSPCNERCESCYDEYYCKDCKEGYVLQNGQCICGVGYYDYYDGNTAICKSCTDPCDETCGANAPCTKCASTSVITDDKCEDISIGFKSSFKNGVITLLFSNLNYYLTKQNFIVKSNNGTLYDTEYWWVERYSDNIYKIHTDLTSSDLPLTVTLDFNRY